MKSPVQIIGQPNSGKTTLVADLITELTSRGMSVGSIKHSSHSHELDKTGKDSFIHRTAGASPAAMVTGKMAAIYLPASEQTKPDILIEKYYGDVDIVLIEGWISGPYPKIEIWRKAVNKPPLFRDLEGVKALVSNDLLTDQDLALAQEKKLTGLVRNGISAIADFIVQQPEPVGPDE